MIVLFILACFGLTQILVYGKILDYIRPKHQFFHCTLCVGFWVGILLYVLMWLLGMSNFTHGIDSIFSWGKAFVMGCVSSGTSYALSGIFSDEGVNIKHN